jgi:two-component system OmpR family response regulator/two-component system response regulator QseB
MRILIVEDDPLLGDGIQAGLRQAGFSADWVRDGVAAGAALAAEHFAAVVLDLGLPRLSGLELLRRLRAAGNAVPVLILTARDAVADRVAGLDAGGDDYMVKPFDLDELAARLRARVRRAHGQAAATLRVGELELDPAAHAARFEGRAVDLSAREFAVLQALTLSAGRVLTREQLEQALYGWGEEVESNAIEVHIHHLRRKLRADLIRTVRGVGYTLARPGAAG